ncbi:hypothetical protein [Arcobacter porcinus]|uniref:hypothetical protein n=1 Tax=Arcobacter porcinus TaxID=1935204 RepID=UPI00081EBAB8|nr:hypothetical protein [Arcobacter porcinus]OCL84267.1 hypothetical protein AAW30_00641 [Arcobacter porcinus]OCL84787.1 hypothetical protein AAW29_00466 [Arcobacter porcinus]
MINSIRIRVFFIFILILSLLTALFSGYFIFQGENYIKIHLISISIFILSLIPHILLRKKRVLKLVKESFKKSSKNKKYDFHNSLDNLSLNSLNSLINNLNLDEKRVKNLLKDLNFDFNNFNESLQDIADNNDFQPQKLFIIIMENHLENITKEK